MDNHTCFLFQSKDKVVSLGSHCVKQERVLVSSFTYQHCFVETFDPPMPFLEIINVLDLVSLYKAKIHVHMNAHTCTCTSDAK